MSRSPSEQEAKWIKSMTRLLKQRPRGTFLFAEGGGTLFLHDIEAYNQHEAGGECLGKLEPLGTAEMGPNFDCGGF